MLGRLREKADFERVLAVPPRRRSTHFAIHFLDASPKGPPDRSTEPRQENLSTDLACERKEPVDDFSALDPTARLAARFAASPRCWLGCVVPKRHARRAVTHNLIKRQMRAVVERLEAQLEPGVWLLRLKSPFSPAQFPSADSRALRLAVRGELEALLGACLSQARQPAASTRA